MTKIIKNSLILKLILGVALSAVFLNVANAATLNTSSSDYPVLQVANYTRNSSCSTCWSNSVSADAGDIISFKFFYHNTSNETATRVAFYLSNIPTNSFTSQSISGQIFAQNAPTVNGSVQVNLTSTQSISLIPGEVYWYDYSTRTTLPLGQSGNEILTSGGLTIGNVEPGVENSGYVVARFRVSGGSTSQTAISSDISTDGSTNGSNEFILFGSVNSRDYSPLAWFEYGTNQSSLTNSTPATQVGLNFGMANFEYRLPKDSLVPNTTYYFRAVARTSTGLIYGNVLSFSTGYINNTAFSPTVITNPATSVLSNSVVLNTSINPNNSNTDYWFEYGTTVNLGTSTALKTLSNYNFQLSLNSSLDNLSPNTTYYFRAVARNNYGTSYGSVLSFTTPQSYSTIAAQPRALTTAAVFVKETSALLNGSVVANNNTTSAWFEWSEDINMITGVNRNAAQNVGAGNSEVYLAYSLSNLTPNKTYYFRLVAQNSFGTTHGNVNHFTTTTYVPASTPITSNTSAGSTVSQDQLILEGELDDNNPKAGQEIIFVINYTNETETTLKNSVLKVTLPNEVNYLASSFADSNVTQNGNVLTFKVGNIDGKLSDSVSIKIKVTELAKAKELKLISEMTYSYSGVSGKESIENKLNVDEASLAASALDILKSIFGSWLIYLILGIIIGAGTYHISNRRKQVVDAEDPLK